MGRLQKCFISFFSVANTVSYRTAGASKTIPGFDVMDYGQEDYVYGDSNPDAKNWSEKLLGVLEEYVDVFSELFNSGE